MLEAVWTVGIVLSAIAAMDRRAWPSLALLALVFVQTAISRAMLDDILSQLAMRPFIDLSAGVLSLGFVTRERWTRIMPATFSLMLLCHGAFWFARSLGVDLWLPYVHAQNALLIAQLIGLAWPSGGNLVGIAGAWYRDLRDGWSRFAGVGVGEVNRSYWQAVAVRINRRPDERANRSLQISTSE